MAKAKPNDRDARAKYNECNKIVKRIAFEKAIAVDDKSVAEQIDLESMGKTTFAACAQDTLLFCLIKQFVW